LDQANFLCFFALLARSNFELNLVALVERLVATAFDVGEVDEHVAAAFSRDEAETFFGIEKLYGACGHCLILHKMGRHRRLTDDVIWSEHPSCDSLPSNRSIECH